MSNPAVEMLKGKTKELEQSSKAAMADAELAADGFVECLEGAGKLDEALELAIFEGDCFDYHRRAVVDWKGRQVEAGEIVERSVREGQVDDKFLETPKQLVERASHGLMEIEHEKPRANPAAHERRHAMERELFDYRRQMADHRLGATDERGQRIAKPVLSERWRDEVANRMEQGLEREADPFVQALAGAGPGIAMLSNRREAYERIERNDRQVEKNMKAIARIESGRETKPAEAEAPSESAVERMARGEARVADAERKLIGSLERGGLLDPFIDQMLARQGMSDHYRDTKLMGGTTTTGREVQDYLGSSLNIAANDVNHDTRKKQAEGHSMQAMLEAHGDAASHERDAGPRVAGQAKKQAEIDLYQYRQALADHVIAGKEYSNLTRGMDAAQIELEGYAKPEKPELPEALRKAICAEAAATAMGKREAERESGAEKSLSQDWPWTKLPGQERGAALEAMIERQAAIRGVSQAAKEREARKEAGRPPARVEAAKGGKAAADAAAMRSLLADIEGRRKPEVAREAERGA